jgi:hypothetical protein
VTSPEIPSPKTQIPSKSQSSKAKPKRIEFSNYRQRRMRANDGAHNQSKRAAVAAEAEASCYVAILTAKTRLVPACHLEVEFLDNRELERLFFVDRKNETFAAWATAIANELIQQILAAE